MNALALITAVLAFAAAAHKAVQYRRDSRNPALLAACVVLSSLGGAVLLAWAPLHVWITNGGGVPNLARYLSHTLALVAVAAMQSMFLFLADPATARRRALWRWLILFVAVAAMGVAFSLGEFAVDDPGHLANRYSDTPELMIYMAAFIGYCLLGAAGVLTMPVRYAPLVPSPTLRLGLRLLAAAVVLGGTYGLHKAAFFALVGAGVEPPWAEAPVSSALTILIVSAVVGGLVVPSVGPYVTEALGWPSRYLLYRQLEPLWTAIYRVNQYAVLSPPLRRPSIADMRFQLDRRVVEIHDGLRSLSRYAELAIENEATIAALRDGQPAETARAVGQAASIAAAIERMTTVPDSHTGNGAGAVATASATAADVEANARSLAPVSRAYARSRQHGLCPPERTVDLPPEQISLAGDFFLVAHDGHSGRPRLRSRTLEVTLAAALLAELLYHNLVYIDGKQLIPMGRTPPTDSLALQVWQLISVERPNRHSVRTWLTYLSETAVDDVTKRLHDAGVIAPMVGRTLRGTTTIWRPTDPSVAASSWARLSALLRAREGLEPLDVALAGLINAAELDAVVLEGAPRYVREHMLSIVDGSWLPLRHLLSETRALIGKEVMTNYVGAGRAS
ncbi:MULTISPECIES: GOLPH3/VPS74 family protein [Asanoa]|uniref:DUF6545 domain-containing protein n=1 Tax=Asanoa siamensis TaxID=926357 RepID=A0ABQ4CSF0_9ACTN|nr:MULTISPECIES: MAB_1171c family putative transporter [Asanoa]GIF74210.1 hypothetical protein Asi02nite_37280 [Asanoa siamensis]